MAGRYPPPFLNTQEDRGAVVTVVSFTFIVVSTLTNCIRVIIRQQSERALGLDDALLVAANVTAIVQTSLVGLSVEHGLGRHFNTLSEESLAAYRKFSYSASILAILSMLLAKISVLQLQRRLCGIQPRSRYIKAMYWIMLGTVIIWALFSTFALAFQCGAARPYTYEADRCSSGALWYPIAVVNAITDIALAFSFSPVILRLSARTRTKVKIMVLLGARVLSTKIQCDAKRRKLTVSRVCIAIMVQIAFLAQGLKGTDQTRAMMKPVIMQQIVMNLSILTAVILSLHNFIANLTAGRFGVEVHESTNESSKTSGGRSGLRPVVSASQSGSGIRSSHSHRLRVRESNSGFRLGRANKSTAWAGAEETDEWEIYDRASHGSQENIIMQTVTWQVSRNEPGSNESSREAELQTSPLEREAGKARAGSML